MEQDYKFDIEIFCNPFLSNGKLTVLLHDHSPTLIKQGNPLCEVNETIFSEISVLFIWM